MTDAHTPVEVCTPQTQTDFEQDLVESQVRATYCITSSHSWFLVFMGYANTEGTTHDMHMVRRLLTGSSNNTTSKQMEDCKWKALSITIFMFNHVRCIVAGFTFQIVVQSSTTTDHDPTNLANLFFLDPLIGSYLVGFWR